MTEIQELIRAMKVELTNSFRNELTRMRLLMSDFVEVMRPIPNAMGRIEKNISNVSQ